ncbi:zinc-binding dehydrogenase [Skeletonema marinoi]|uniref:Zinc-binding dehydrogenase n=1 Tax=Skeletonema marinoi TaxID=267567 RepID=A0AAD9D3B2_9STRA|nr:zinc-binding dehydrogenase [Skeletonema marinoi]
MPALSSNPKDTDPYQFDNQVLKKLETTRTSRGRTNTNDSSPRCRANTDSSRDTALSGSIATGDPRFFEQRNDDDATRQSPVQRQTSIENFIDQQQQTHHGQHHRNEQAAAFGDDGPNAQVVDASSSHPGSAKQLFTRYEKLHFLDHTNPTNGVAERNLPDAILRLDRRHAIPRPRHKNDVLIEIEASTVDKRDLMTRPGVRCATSLPIGVETTCLDCIGRVVQLSTHARAIHGIEVDDRVAAIYPFEYKDEKSNNHQYTLVDAALVVNVPRNVDAAMASCMTRLYTTAFQAIQLGLSDMHDRYGLNQLSGKSLLVQDGDTELGRALIELAVELGASQIFATGPSGVHDRLRDMGATPLGAETFGWELFVEEKLSLVLVQEVPTPETFESFMSLLGQDRGMVYVQPPNNINHDDNCNVIFSDDSFDGREFLHDLANKAKGAFVSAKFNCQLTCSQQFSTYDGIWASAKEDQILFKKDLRFLLTLLSEGKLSPQVEERVCLEDVPGVQDRIELEGKQGTIVCLPTTLFEKKARVVGALKSKNRSSQTSAEQSHSRRNSDTSSTSRPNNQDITSYAADSGYIRPNYDTLSDFNFLTPKPFEDESSTSNSPFLDRATSFTLANNGKSGESFLSFGNSFATWEGDFDVKEDKATKKKIKKKKDEDEVTDILEQHEKEEDAKEEVKVKAKEEGEEVESKATTAKKEERLATNQLNKRAQAALQRKRESRARMRKAHQEKSSPSESIDQKKADVKVTEENQSVPGSRGKEEVDVEMKMESQAAPPSSSPAWKEVNNSSNETPSVHARPVTRTNRPTPEWLKGVRPQSSAPSASTSGNNSGPVVRRNARPTPEWMKGASSETKHSEYVPSKYRFSKPPVQTVAIEDGRDDDDVSATSNFSSVMSKWKAVENRA